MAKPATPAGAVEARATDLTAILARLDELEKRHEAMRGVLAELAGTVASHTETLAVETARLMDGDFVAAELVEGYDARGEVLKAFRQIEAIANHINVKLPA